jgi:hypothetical protein
MIVIVLAAALAQDIDRQIDDFARKVAHEKLRETLLSRHGKPALREQLGSVAAEAREAARKDVLPAYFREHFDDKGRLREGSKKHAEQLIADLKQAEEDLKELREKLAGFVEKVADEPAVNASIKRTLRNEGFVGLLYLAHLRPAMGRDDRKLEEALMKKLGGALVDDGEGGLRVREDVVDKLEEALNKLQDRAERADELARALAEFASKLKEEGITGKLKKALNGSAAAAIVLKQASEAEPTAIIEQMEKACSGDGVLLEEHAEKVGKLLTALTDGQRRVDAFRRVLDRIADRIRADDTHATLKRLMRHDAVRIDIVAEYAPAELGTAATVGEAWDRLAATIFEESDGVWRVQEAVADKLTEGLAKVGREARSLKQAIDQIGAEAKRVSEAEAVKAVYLSPVGAALLVDGFKSKAENIRVTDEQAFKAWIARHFEEQGGAFTVREGSQKTIDALIEKAEKTRKQLENSDIPTDK